MWNCSLVLKFLLFIHCCIHCFYSLFIYVVWSVRNSSWWLPAVLCICCYTCFVMSCAVLVGFLVWSLWVVAEGGGLWLVGFKKRFKDRVGEYGMVVV